VQKLGRRVLQILETSFVPPLLTVFPQTEWLIDFEGLWLNASLRQ
jgi:hypothetical protein